MQSKIDFQVIIWVVYIEPKQKNLENFMKLYIETNSKITFTKLFEENLFKSIYIKENEIFIIEDNVSFGTNETLIVGVYFMVESIKSGIVYDVIKEIYYLITQKINSKKNNVNIKYYSKDKHGNIKKIEIENIGQGKIKIDDTEIKIQP